VGVALGLAVNAVWGGDHPSVGWVIYHVTEPIGTLFLRALLMIVIPLIGSSLIVGVAAIGDVRRLGRVGLRSFAYCFVLSAISVVIGLGLANSIQPGRRVRPETAERLRARYGADAEKRVQAVAAERKAAPRWAGARRPRCSSSCSWRWWRGWPSRSCRRRWPSPS
jgi:DAACS family dicarboxylate/amino acid:cation (Na+ or H+) symporter